MSNTGTGLWPFAMQTFRRRPSIETHPTTESVPGTRRKPSRTGTTHRIPAACEGNPRRPRDVFALLPASLHTTSCAHEREVDSPLTVNALQWEKRIRISDGGIAARHNLGKLFANGGNLCQTSPQNPSTESATATCPPPFGPTTAKPDIFTTQHFAEFTKMVMYGATPPHSRTATCPTLPRPPPIPIRGFISRRPTR